jgi:hypothetical protein
MNRTDDRLIPYAPSIPIPSHTIWDLYTRATAVGVSVWPAEYTMATPNIESRSAVMTSG